MGADPRTLRRDLAQQQIERRARLALMDRIDPDQNAVHGQQLVADEIGECLVIDDGIGLDAGSSERFEDANETTVLWRRLAARRGISTPQDGDLGTTN